MSEKMRNIINHIIVFTVMAVSAYVFQKLMVGGEYQQAIGTLAVMAIGQGLKAAYGLYKGATAGRRVPKTPEYQVSAQEKRFEAELNRRIKEGVLSPEAAQMIRNKALQTAYGAAERGAGRIQQNLARRGFEGSAIGAEATAGQYAEAVNVAGETGRDIALYNEQSKIRAFNQLGQLGQRRSGQMYQDAMMKYGRQQEIAGIRNQAYDTAFSSAVDAGVMGIGAYQAGRTTGQSQAGRTTGQSYTVKEDDTLGSIAQQTGVNWQDIYEQNQSIIGDDPNRIKAGMILNLGGGGGALSDYLMSLPENEKQSFLQSFPPALRRTLVGP